MILCLCSTAGIVLLSVQRAGRSRKKKAEKASSRRSEREIISVWLREAFRGSPEHIPFQPAYAFTRNLPVRPYDNILVDEAAQAYEAEWAGIFGLGTRRVILIGDPHQLAAKIQDKSLRDAGFDRSLLGRCMHSTGHAIVMLDTNYRSHATIISLPGKQFYKHLKAGRHVSNFPRVKGVYFPTDERTAFIHMAGEEYGDRDGYSRSVLEVAEGKT